MTICRDTSERRICVFFAVFQKAITFVLSRVVQFIENKTTMNRKINRDIRAYQRRTLNRVVFSAVLLNLSKSES